MIRDAFVSELVKATHNRANLFWGFLFSPLLGFVLALAVSIWTRTHLPAGGIIPAQPLGAAAFAAFGAPGNAFYGLFWIIGAAGIFAAEYRFSTFRYMLVRNSRLNVLAAKLGVFALLTVVSLLLFLVGNLIATVIDAAIGHVAVKPGGPEAGVLMSSLAITFLAGLLRMLGIAALVALAATATRSMIGCLITILVLLVVEALVGARISATGEPAWLAASLPGLAFSHVQVWAAQRMAGAGIMDSIDLTGAFVCLLGWVAVPAGAAAALFQRQDLSRE